MRKPRREYSPGGRASVELRNVGDRHVAPLLLQVFRYQAAVTVFRSFFAAEETSIVENFARHIFDLPRAHQAQEAALVCAPVSRLLFLVLVEHLGCGRELRQVKIFDVADHPGEITQVVFLGEAGKLRTIVEPDVNQPPDAGLLQAGEENLCRLFRESDGKDLQSTNSSRATLFVLKERPAERRKSRRLKTALPANVNALRLHFENIAKAIRPTGIGGSI